jgi:hypothetical protein
MEIARGILAVVGAYGGIGLLFAVAFVTLGIQRVDPAARGTGWGFRLLVLPGVVALWPFLAMRWLRS